MGPRTKRRHGAATHAVVALVLALLGGAALLEGFRQQARVDQAWIEATLAEYFRALLMAPDEPAIRAQVRALEHDRSLRLSFLAVRDAAGRVLASTGAFENFDMPGISAVRRVQVRTVLYRLSSRHGEVVISGDDALPWGVIEFAGFHRLRGEVQIAAVTALKRLGSCLLLLAAGLFLWGWWRHSRPPAMATVDQMMERIRGPTAAPPSILEPAEADPRAPLMMLAGLNIAAMRFDGEGRLQAMNEPAERWTGWRERDAVGRPLLSILHLVDAQGRPQLQSLAELSTDPLPSSLQQPLQVLGRKGSKRAVLLKLTLTPDIRAGREGGVLTLSDAEAQVTEATTLRAEAAQLRHALSRLDHAILLVGKDGQIQAAYGSAHAMLGYRGAEWSGLTLAKLFPVPFVQTPTLTLASYEDSDSEAPLVRAWRKDAQSFPVSLKAQPLADGGWVLQVDDLREAGHLQLMAQRERRWFELGADQAFVMDAQTLSFLEVSAAAKAQLGYPPLRWAQLTLPSLAPELDRAAFQAWLRALREGQVEVVHYITRHRSADDTWMPVRVALQYLDDGSRPVYLATATRIDTAS